MHVVIMGCGRVGATLARGLERYGHTVSVIDLDVNAFRRLGPDFQGRTVKGVGFDKDVLVKAGINDAGGFAAVSSGDNSNILAVRVVRERFGVENVAARVYDQGRADLYEKLGIPAVAAVRWTAVEVMNRLMDTPVVPAWRDPSGLTMVAAPHFHPGWVGQTMRAIEQGTQARVVSLMRMGQGRVPTDDVLLQDGDVLYLSLPTARADEVYGAVSAAPARH